MKMTSQEALSLLEQMIATPSVSRQEENTADLLAAFLEDHGVEARRHYNNVFALSKQWDPAKPTLLLCSHHDTVKPSAAYTRDPFTPVREQGRLYGLGSNDAGASVVALTAAFCNHYDSALPFNLLLLIGAEEEVMGEHGMRAMVPYFREQGLSVDMALVGEPTGLDAAVGERGLVVLDCVAKGVQGHAARDTGVNAIYVAIDDIRRLREFRFPKVSSVLGDIKVTTTMIDAGTQHNVVPDACHFVVDVRTTDAYSNEEVVRLLQAVLQSEATPRSTRIHASVVADGHPLVRAARRLGRQTFVSLTTSDRALMPFPALKMGPGQSDRSHTADEFVEVREVEEGVRSYNDYINTLAEEQL